MVRRSFIGHVFRCLLLCGAAGGFGLAPFSSAAAQSLGKPTNQPKFRLSKASPEMESGVNSVFATRWGDPALDFSLGVDGKVRPQVHSDAGGEIEGPPALRTERMVLSKPSQIRSISVKPDTPLSGKCGPSPTDPEGIKSLVVEAARRHRVDPTFALAIAFAESRFDRQRNSSKGARGPMQLMPATAARFDVDDVCNPVSNIDGGVAYLRELFDEFRNPLLVAAAYNAGENRIRGLGGIPPIPETLGFVAEVINYQMGIGLSAERTAPIERTIAKPSNDADIPAKASLASATRRQWVDGVMQF